MTRAAVHAASGHPLGAADPRQEDGPADLRLVPPALAAWVAAALAPDAPAGWTAGAVLAGLAVTGVLLVRAALAAAPGRRAGVRRRVNGVAAAAVLLCAAAGAGSAWLHGADRHRGPVPGLAERYARVTVDLTVTSDPRSTRPRVRGDALSSAGLVLDADLTRVTSADGAVTTVRTPVLVFAASGAGADERTQAWRRLLPSTGLRVAGRLAPPAEGDGRYAALLRVEGSGPPRVVRPPTRLQRTAGDLRAGLREATEGLPPDARALLPGLVVGDTSRIPPELHDAFTATDLSHLLAVSGSNLTIVLALLIGPPGLALRAERRGLARGWGSRCARPPCSAGPSRSPSWWSADRNRACCGRLPAD